jgi:dihydroorotate dehydrogenase (fumarate)/dihydroorotate dehydrogenase
MDFYRHVARPVLFRFDPEQIHSLTLRSASRFAHFPLGRRALEALYHFDDPRLHQTIGNLEFPNPVGLPGGFDKNGSAIDALAAVGFGAIDIGSVSRHPSPGNLERPRLFRLPLDQAIRIFYGVPNDGAAIVSERLRQAKPRLRVPLGINLVETNTGVLLPPDAIIEEIAEAYRPFQGIADYIVINTNCPNSGGGASVLEQPDNMRALLTAFRRYPHLPPMFVKAYFYPQPETIDVFLDVVGQFDFVKGILPGYIDKRLPPLRTPKAAFDKMRGSLTGPHTCQAGHELVRAWYKRIDPKRHVLISSCGIFSAKDAYARIRSGASLIQFYTALVYRGPGLVKQIKEELCVLLERDGFTNIAQAVGADAADKPAIQAA